MVNRSKAKGTSWEVAVRDYLRSNGWPNTERLPTEGSKDRGDLVGIPGVVHELKSCRRLELGSWIAEAETERVNAGAKVGVVWHKRIGKTSPADGYVTMTGAQYVALLKGAGY